MVQSDHERDEAVAQAGLSSMNLMTKIERNSKK